jgi:AcrR family transcriptional regulator
MRLLDTAGREMVKTSGPLRPQVAGRVAERKQRTRAAIQGAAAQLFSVQGYDSTTMQEIASLADVGLGTLYGYFPSKEDVLRTILGERTEASVASTLDELRQTQGAVDRARVILRHVWDYLVENRKMSLALFAIDASRTVDGRQSSDRTYRALMSVLEQGQTTGEVASVPLETTVKSLLSTYNWAALELGIWQNPEDHAAVRADLDRLTVRLLSPRQD